MDNEVQRFFDSINFSSDAFIGTTVKKDIFNRASKVYNVVLTCPNIIDKQSVDALFLACKNKIKGYVYYPENKESFLCFGYAKCKKLKEYENILTEKDENNELKNARMKDIDVSDKNRIELIKFLKKFYDEYNIKSSPKGLYLHGSFGSGKTFLLACLLNELEIKKHISYEIVYYPELLRTLKEDLSLVESKVSYYSNVEILVLDDIGAENVTNWGRDEILGTILQERMNKHKTTFFTSNLDINELEKHLSCSKDNVDNVKARRIIERIKQLTIDMPLISVNRRN